MTRLIVAAALVLTACGANQQQVQTESKVDAMGRKLETLQQAYAAQQQRLESLKDQVALLEDRLEARDIHTASAAGAIPAGLPRVRVAPPEPVAGRPEPPPVTITQEDVDALSRPARQARGGPRLPVAPPENAARAGNIGVMPLKPPSAMPDLPAAVAPPTPPEDGAVHLYKRGMALQKTGDYTRAITTFDELVRRFPQHDYADNALLALGQCRFARAEFPGALKTFKQVIERYPGGNMIPEALLMVGLTQQKLGQLAEGRQTLGRLAATFPNTGAGRRAATELEKRR